jgi:hypothetical protein
MGPWGIAALLAVAAVTTKTGKVYLKKALKVGIAAGYDAKEAVDGLVEKTKEYKDELVAEIKSDLRDEHSEDGSHKKVGAKSKSAPNKANHQAEA